MLVTGAYSSDIDQEVKCERPGDPIIVRTSMTFDFATNYPPSQSRFLPPPGMELSEALTFLLAGRVPHEVYESSNSTPTLTPFPTRSSSPADNHCNSLADDEGSAAASDLVDLNDEDLCDTCLRKLTIASVLDCDCEEGEVEKVGYLSCNLVRPFN